MKILTALALVLVLPVACSAQAQPPAAILQSDNSMTNSSSPSSSGRLYHETLRPQFHFTAKTGWLNDPNGLVYFDGEYHLFYQFDTQLVGRDSHKIWGHAVSADLVHWHQLADALEPDALGPIWSGSAVVDWNNTSGFGSAGKPALVAVYTAAGGRSPESEGRTFTQCLAYSTDRGRTWTKYAQNPALPHVAGENRDPKVIWYAPTRRWIMALWLDGDRFGLFSSPDLKDWHPIQTLSLPGSSECPDFFPLPLEGAHEDRWVFTAGNGHYFVGRFDGETFTPETPALTGDAGANTYAAQTFSDIPAPDGRRIQITWMRDGQYPNMPFNQQMGFPCTLTLHPTPEGPRLFRRPVHEIAKLYSGTARQQNITLQPGAAHFLPAADSELLDMEAEFAPTPGAAAFGLRVRGIDIRYDAAAQTLSCLGRTVSLAPEAGRITLRLLLDRTSLEVYGNQGRVSLTSCFSPAAHNTSAAAYAEGGAVTLVSLTVHPLRSAWASP